MTNQFNWQKGLHLTLFGLMTGGVLVLFVFQIIYAGKVAPNTFSLNANISFQEAEEAQEAYSQALDEFEIQPITITFKGETHTFTLAELGISLIKTESVQGIPIISPSSSVSSVWLVEKQVKSKYKIDQKTFHEALNSRIINLNVAPEEPLITWNPSNQDFDILQEKTGWKSDLEEFQNNLETNIANLEPVNLEIQAIETFPETTKEQIEPIKSLLKEKLDQNTAIFTDSDEWEIKWRENMHLLNFIPTEGEKGATVAIQVDESVMNEHMSRYLAPEIETAAQDVTILQDEEGKITFEGTAIDGLEIDYDIFNNFLNLALKNSLNRVEIPLKTTKGQVYAPESLQELGITELVATGYSNYWGSPYNRRHNIAVAIEQFNGVLVESGAIFSFGDVLGVVDGSTGYAKELVIKENETIPEYGGGVCQVSSTLFRAILFGGFPIVERKAHSYAVSYYAYPLGWGLDATVYPPAVDLKFKNDMAHPILIQSYVEGNDAYYKFYGTKDDRIVGMDGPYTGNHAAAPDPIYTVTSELKPGVIEQKDTAHNGFTASWNRTITYPEGHLEHPDGATITETIVSPYAPWPAKYNVGEGTEGYESD